MLTVACNIHDDTQVAPMLIMHGTKDRTVNTRCSVNLYQRLIETGHECSLYLLRGADHGGPEFWTEQALTIVDAFLREHLG
jgi:dipeptidyl aminopeptidase/acylaminoacyl peptidase